jgi:hypothetical protein
VQYSIANIEYLGPQHLSALMRGSFKGMRVMNKVIQRTLSLLKPDPERDQPCPNRDFDAKRGPPG